MIQRNLLLSLGVFLLVLIPDAYLYAGHFLPTTRHAGHILPTPLHVTEKEGHFTFQPEMNIGYAGIGRETAGWLKKALAVPTGYPCRILTSNPGKAGFLLTRNGFPDTLNDEGYLLEIKPHQVTIRAHSETGLFYGVQSLLQCFPPEIYARKPVTGIQWKAGCIKVADEPKYGWRGFMMDSGRQYHSPDFIKRYLDLMAMLKMNVFHWHLTEGLGWRIAIETYPKLTAIGAYVADGKEQQGYYTREEIKDIVEYAGKRHINVVPEIDVPGHSEAALIAYPELTCSGHPPKPSMSASPVIFCGGNEQTYAFLENVLDEVGELFPSKYIHLGGDEAKKAEWKKCPLCQQKIKEEGLENEHQLQLYFSKRLANHLQDQGRKVIFWGDVVYTDGISLPDNVVVQWWNYRFHKDRALQNALKRGIPVIASTNYYSYLNFPVTPWLPHYKENRTFDIQTAYEQNHGDLSPPPGHVLGMETCLWTDWHVLEDMVDMRVFPRIYALAEQMWHRGEKLPFNTFYNRVKEQYPILEQRDVDYGPALKEHVPENYSWE